jgi:hypothetical protein
MKFGNPKTEDSKNVKFSGDQNVFNKNFQPFNQPFNQPVSKFNPFLNLNNNITEKKNSSLKNGLNLDTG